MKVLLDTHTFIWWNGDLSLLSRAARSICEDKENILMLSLVSIWEMQIKGQLGKLAFHQPLPEIIESQQRDNGVELLSVTTEHIYALQNLPSHHRDPFDRLLIAQANIEKIPVVTSDPLFQRYEVDVLG